MYYFAGPAENPTKVATDFVEERLTSSGYIVKNAYTSDHNGVTHVYLRQVVDGLEVVNGDINVNVDRSGRVISYGNSFYKGHSNPEDRHMSIQDWVRREDAHLLERDRQLTFGKRCRSGVRSE
ncbi:Fungalysin/Thermolysin Extracellular metalloproteinase 5, partial [Mortierella sp. GBA43]